MKIAFCISGQFRNEELFFEHTAKISKNLDAKVFISTWSARGAKTSGAQNIHQLPRMFGIFFTLCMPQRMVGHQGVAKTLPEFEQEVEHQISLGTPSVSSDDVKRFFSNAVIDIEDNDNFAFPFEITTDDNNSLKMLYKIWKCNELRLAYERRTGNEFDFIVRLRPDVIPNKINHEILNKSITVDRNILLTEAVKPNYVTDQIAISNSYVANIYASLFGKALLTPSRPWRHIHHELYHHLVDNNIEIRQGNLRSGVKIPDTQQRMNRKVALSLIESGRFSTKYIKNMAEQQAIFRILSVGNFLEEQMWENALENTLLINVSNLASDLRAAAACAVFLLACSENNPELAQPELAQCALTLACAQDDSYKIVLSKHDDKTRVLLEKYAMINSDFKVPVKAFTFERFMSIIQQGKGELFEKLRLMQNLLEENIIKESISYLRLRAT